MIKNRFQIRRSLFLFVCSLFIFFPSSMQAGTLQGTVKGKNGQLKQYVRIDIGGQQQKTTYTNQDGTFSLDLQGGSYSILVTERNKRMKFSVVIPIEGVKQKTFFLEW